MSNDKLMDNFKETLHKAIEDSVKKGIPAENIKQSIDNLDYTQLFLDTSKVSAEGVIKHFHDHMYEIAFEEQLRRDKFVAHHNQIWGKCFAASNALYAMAVEAIQNYYDYVSKDLEDSIRIPKQYTFLVLQHMQGRACQIFLEILFLMRNGFADGAFARWRSMYELTLCAHFILSQDEKIAKQYYEKSKVDSITTENSYRWMEGSIDHDGKEIKKFRFITIEQYCNSDNTFHPRWRQEYVLACSVTHPSPEGTFGRLGNMYSTGTIPVGHSDYGIAPAAENSAISLNCITAMFLNVYPNLESLAIMQAMSKWVDIICDYYSTTTKECFVETENEDEENATE